MAWGLAMLVLAAVLGTAMTARAQAPAGAPDSFADLSERLLPAVVNISTTQTVDRRQFDGPAIPQFPPGSPFEEFFRDFFENQQRSPNAPPRRATSLGSGFIISPDGYVVTNNHVIEGADEIRVILYDDTSLTATLVGVDDKTDIAVLKVESEEPLPFVEWGDSEKMRVGDWIIAIGNPFGLGGSVTAGIISARARDINQGPYDDFLQTDASINRGNSGGPMFNLAGEVIGMNTAIFSPTGGSVGIGFAIPSSIVRPVASQLIEYGRTRRGWLGVRIQTVTDEIAESLGLDRAYGALVASVTPGGPAEAAGIRAGDVIVGFDDREVEDMRRLPRLVAETEVERRVKVEIIRQGERRTVEVELGELEEAENEGLLSEEEGGGSAAPEQTLSALGITLAEITDELRQRYRIDPSLEGVVITRVEPGSPAAEKGLLEGEVIVEVGQVPVTHPREIAEAVDNAREAGRRSVLLLLDGEAGIRFVALNVGN
jgi:serine protease Do